MATWPALPGHGEFVTLPLALPPRLLDAAGYDGHARYVALWLCGDDAMIGDASTTRTGRWHGFEVFWNHTLTRALLGPYSLLPPDDDPYLDAPHRLLADRWEHTLAVGDSADVNAFVRSEPNPLAALTEGMEAAQIA